MGRAPDHVASCLSGMYMGLDVFEASDPARAGALRDYYRFARDRDLFLIYVIINPLADRARSAHEQGDDSADRAHLRSRLAGHHGQGRQDAGHQRRAWRTKSSSPPFSRSSPATRRTPSRSPCP